jgi:phospholipase/carboxylesterase
MSESDSLLEHIVQETGPSPSWSVIWLHGLGADGNDFVPVAPELGFRDDPAIRFVFPHAPVRPITINGGMHMRGWYDIRGMAFDRQEDRAGIEDSADHVARFIAAENARGIPTERIFLAGFSQGGAVSLFAGLRYPQSLAGIIALSTYLPVSDTTPVERHEANSGTRIFLAHGVADPVIPLALAEQSRGLLIDMGYAVEWHTYPMPHSVNMEEIGHVAGFMDSIVKRGD